MRSTCANKKCRSALSVTNRSGDNPAYCGDCGDFVWAMRPNQALPHDWYFVAERRPTAGEIVMADQCEECGLNAYEIQQEGRHAWSAVCNGQVSEGVRQEGCGARHPVRSKLSKDVVF